MRKMSLGTVNCIPDLNHNNEALSWFEASMHLIRFIQIIVAPKQLLWYIARNMLVISMQLNKEKNMVNNYIPDLNHDNMALS